MKAFLTRHRGLFAGLLIGFVFGSSAVYYAKYLSAEAEKEKAWQEGQKAMQVQAAKKRRSEEFLKKRWAQLAEETRKWESNARVGYHPKSVLEPPRHFTPSSPPVRGSGVRRHE